MPPPVLDNVMRLAARHHAAGRVREAAAVYQQVLHKDPHHPGALHGLGVMAYQTGRPTAAEKLLVRALAADPNRASAHDDLANLRLALGRPDEALAGYRQAIRLEPTFALAHAHLGTALARLGQFEQAVAAYQRAVELGVQARRRRVAGIAVAPPAAGPAGLPAASVAPEEPAAPPPAVEPDGPPPAPVEAGDPTAPGGGGGGGGAGGGADATPDDLWIAALVEQAADVPGQGVPSADGWAVPAAVTTAPPVTDPGHDVGRGAEAGHLAVVEPDLGDPRVDAPWAAALAPAEDVAEPMVAASPDPTAVGVEPVPPPAAGESTWVPDAGTADDGDGPVVVGTPPASLELVVTAPPGGGLTDVAASSVIPDEPGAGEAFSAADASAFGIAAYVPRPTHDDTTRAPAAPDKLTTYPPARSRLDLMLPNDTQPAAARGVGQLAEADPAPHRGAAGLAGVGVTGVWSPAPDATAVAADGGALVAPDGVSVGGVSADGAARSIAFARAGVGDRPAPPALAVAGRAGADRPRPGTSADGNAAIAAAHRLVGWSPPAARPTSASSPVAAEEDDVVAVEGADAATDLAAAGPAADGARVVSLSELDLPTGDQDPLVATRLLAKQLRRVRRAPGAAAQQALELHKEGSIHLRQRRVDEAIAALRRLVELHPTSARAYRDLGAAYLRADRLDEAQAALVKALELRPRFADAFASIGDVFHLQGKVDEAIACYRKALQLKPSAAKVHSNLLLTLNYHRKLDAKAIFAEHVRWAEQHADALAGQAPEHENDPDPDRPIRVGYVSPDFRRHSVNYFVEPLLAARDRAGFHVTCYSDVIRPDDETDRIMTLCDRWRDVRQLSDEEVARLVRDDGIDILVDLAGHTGTNRLGAFARKPAPVQVTYLGYPNTTGMRAVDYRITDAAADPPGKTEALHAEQLVRLPHFLCYQPPDGAPDPGPPPVAANGFVTFGCFNVLAKVTPEAMGLWAKTMAVLPNSRLVMKDRLGTLAYPARRRYVQDIFAYHRVSADRLELLGKEPDFGAHLAAYRKVDVMLDPFPYNGTTTTCEALWMGVPVVALAGARHAARVGVSVLQAAGLAELVAATPEAYARTAVSLARDPQRLADLRGTLRERLSASPLLDAPTFAASLENAYRDMWQRWCRAPHDGAGMVDTLSLSDE